MSNLNNLFSSALPLLSNARFALRQIKSNDLLRWFNHLRLPEVSEHMSWNVQDIAELQQFLAPIDWSKPGAQIKFAIVEKVSDLLIGAIGFHSVTFVDESDTNSIFSAEISYDLNPQYWGQGIAADACLALSTWAQQQESCSRIYASALDTNLASQRMLEKCGFQKVQRLEHHRLVRGEPRDYFLYMLDAKNS